MLCISRYVVPLCTISYLYIRVSRELKVRENSMRLHESRYSTESYIVSNRSTRTDNRYMIDDGTSGRSSGSFRGTNVEDDDLKPEDFEIDVIKEKRTQKYLVLTITVYGICLCPIMILRLVRLALMETYDNSASLDITFTAFVWLDFAPACVTPIVYTAWQLSRSSRERLRGYFRFSDRKLRRSCETVITTAARTPSVLKRGCKSEEREQIDDLGMRSPSLLDGRSVRESGGS
ncbi:hypothetical protein WA026_018082 [Henosepilachna vigintioctopunctata]|uniref:G-protein coupled receptors family 1 profile domain-containing protein n=1 Tax=Henosepilachna vigintioctopunctata TaxID=420089 RepID=A0AAW1UN07_9CUCU